MASQISCPLLLSTATSIKLLLTLLPYPAQPFPGSPRVCIGDIPTPYSRDWGIETDFSLLGKCSCRNHLFLPREVLWGLWLPRRQLLSSFVPLIQLLLALGTAFVRQGPFFFFFSRTVCVTKYASMKHMCRWQTIAVSSQGGNPFVTVSSLVPIVLPSETPIHQDKFGSAGVYQDAVQTPSL